jgi:transcription antitermination factor NusA-like protein
LKIIKELNEEKIPIIRIDNSLEKFIKMPIFQEKVDKANEMLRTVGLPKIAIK